MLKKHSDLTKYFGNYKMCNTGHIFIIFIHMLVLLLKKLWFLIYWNDFTLIYEIHVENAMKHLSIDNNEFK